MAAVDDQDNCVNHLKEIGIYTDAEAEVVAEFKEVFEPRNFPPGASLLFGFSASGDISIAFSEGDFMPEKYKAVIENNALCLAMFDSIIGKHGVSPSAKRSLALRLAKLLDNSRQTTKNRMQKSYMHEQKIKKKKLNLHHAMPVPNRALL